MLEFRVAPAFENESPTLVLLHAFPLSASMWNAAIAHLKILAPDLSIALVEFPGIGKSTRLENWTMDSFAEQLDAKLREARIAKIILAGCSMGGYAALAYCKAFPLRLSALILSNTKAEADTEEAKQDRELFARDVETRGPIATIERMVPKFLVGMSDLNQASREERLTGWIEQNDPVALAAALRAMASRENSTLMLPKISIPTLVIAGESDPIIPADSMRAMAAAIPNSEFISMPSTGHLAPFDQPKAWAIHVAKFIADHNE